MAGVAVCLPRLQIRVRAREGWEEIFLTYVGPEYADLAKLAAYLEGARVVRVHVFGPGPAPLAEWEWPVTWVGSAGPETALTGVQVYAVRGAEVRRVWLGDRVVGTVVVTPYAEECSLAGLWAGGDATCERSRQAWRTFEALEAALAQAGMDFSHVVRTWLFLQDILDWYEEFNAVRTTFYRARGVWDGLLPASTGIGAANPGGVALVAAAFAVKPRSAAVRARAVASPLQCPATQYASAFSRAVELETPGCRRLLVSGTASLDRAGRTVHAGDVRQQIAHTFAVVEALLHSRQVGWEDVTRATAYVRWARDACAVQRFLRARPSLAELPITIAHNTICRPDLLFELEVDAWRGGP
jgi:enamine deaminase RidA (YjgF/YER057c/UK114 family)